MKRALSITLALALSATVSGCGASIADLPVPGSYVSGDTYEVDIQFSSVLNLPTKAKVVLDGADVGLLDSVQLKGNSVIARVSIQEAVSLPATTRAELRQGTLLGEIYVSLQRPTGSGQAEGQPESDGAGDDLRDGDMIPLDRTTSADNMEDVLRGLSEVIAGGHIEDVQRSIERFNRAIPQNPATVDLINSKAREALNDLATHSDELDRILKAAQTVTQSFADKTATLETILTSGPERVGGPADSLLVVVSAIIDIGCMSRGIGDLVNPVAGDLKSVIATLSPTIGTLATADITAPMLASQVDALLRAKLVPFFAATPNVNITPLSGEVSSGAAPVDRATEMITVLRSIGIVR